MNQLIYFGRWLRAVFWRWQNWAGGAGVGGAGGVFINLWERITGKTMDKSLYLEVFLGLFLIGAFFLAWRDEHIKRLQAESPLEPKDSLRRRLRSLMDEVDLFLQSWSSERNQVLTTNLNGPGDYIQRIHGLDQARIDLYRVQLHPRVLSIVQELRAKGIFQNTPGRTYSIEEITTSTIDEADVRWLRALSWRLDHQDECVRN